VVGVASVDAGPARRLARSPKVLAGTFGPFCATGEGPATTITPGSPFTVPAP